MIHPFNILEGGVNYSLGKFDGQNVIYDFPKILLYLAVKGKMLFGQNFRIYEEDKEILLMLCNYFIKDLDNCKKNEIDPEKGLLLLGPVGCGKTSLIKLLRFIVPHQPAFEVIPCRNIVFGFNHIGYKTIEDFGDAGFFCFDDLGAEPMGRHYAKDCNVMGEILISRHDIFLKYKARTHATTNLNVEELEERYGNRVRSRMRQLFNMIAFDKNAPDKRK